MSPLTTASKKVPAKEQLLDVSAHVYKGPDYSRLVDQLSLADYPDVFPETLVKNLRDVQGDSDAVWSVIADIQETSDALEIVADKASLLARVSDELDSRLEELSELDKEKLSEINFSSLLNDAADNLCGYSKEATKYTKEEAMKEVASWFDPPAAQLLQGGK